MFKMGLLASTAMTAVTLLLSGAPTGVYAETDMHVASHDPNTRFLCTYGRFEVSSWSSNVNSGSGSGYRWEHVAVAVKGHGQTVSRIRVIEAQAPNTSASSFTAGIYSDDAGFPGQPIAVGTGTATPTCGPVKVSITPTTLKRHTTYWIVETTSTSKRCRPMRAGSDANRRKFRPYRCSAFGGLYWEVDPNTKRKAYVQRHYASFSSGNLVSSSTSPWNEQSAGPYFKLK